MPISVQFNRCHPIWRVSESQASLFQEACVFLVLFTRYGVFCPGAFDAYKLALYEGKELTLNSLVPCASVLNGIGLTATISFLACLGIDSPDYYMKRMLHTSY
jgi:hypothetical protein